VDQFVTLATDQQDLAEADGEQAACERSERHR
jgi:hypothetical protein